MLCSKENIPRICMQSSSYSWHMSKCKSVSCYTLHQFWATYSFKLCFALRLHSEYFGWLVRFFQFSAIQGTCWPFYAVNLKNLKFCWSKTKKIHACSMGASIKARCRKVGLNLIVWCVGILLLQHWHTSFLCCSRNLCFMSRISWMMVGMRRTDKNFRQHELRVGSRTYT